MAKGAEIQITRSYADLSDPDNFKKLVTNLAKSLKEHQKKKAC